MAGTLTIRMPLTMAISVLTTLTEIVDHTATAIDEALAAERDVPTPAPPKNEASVPIQTRRVPEPSAASLIATMEGTDEDTEDDEAPDWLDEWPELEIYAEVEE